MVSMKRADRNPVYGAKLSSVVPASVTGDDKVRHELADQDLALKLHYIKGVYVFREDAVRGLSIYDLKKPMFSWLDLFPAASGRIRRGEDDGDDSSPGRPFVKCNDSGVRIVEARCELTVEEWLSGTEEGLHSADDTLAYDQVLGPDLGFSPLVYVQFTWFKCGGMSLGLSWAHLIGDFFSASSFINLWAHLLSGHVPPSCLHVPPPPTPTDSPSPFKPVAPVGDLWIAPGSHVMGMLSLRVKPEQLERLHALSGVDIPHNLPAFELISAVLWKSVSRARADLGTRSVVVCERRRAPSGDAFESPVNAMSFGRAEADFSVAEADVEEIIGAIRKRKKVKGWAMEHPTGDYVAYGSELTFVDLEGLEIGGVEINGKKAVFASYAVGGVGEGGAVVVLPEVAGKGTGRRVNVIMPEAELDKVRDELTVTWGL